MAPLRDDGAGLVLAGNAVRVPRRGLRIVRDSDGSLWLWLVRRRRSTGRLLWPPPFKIIIPLRHNARPHRLRDDARERDTP